MYKVLILNKRLFKIVPKAVGKSKISSYLTLMKEIWKNIVGYETYQISNFGNIKSLGNNKQRKEKFIKTSYLPKLYECVRLCKNGKSKKFYVHRLVAISFIDNPNNLPLVCHADNNPQNNKISNLYWGTYKDNTQQAISENRFIVKTFSTETYVCPHCNKSGKSYVMYRWHFDNCKQIK